MYRRLREVFCCVALCVPWLAAAQDARLTIPLNSGWRFVQQDGLSGAQAPDFDDSHWAAVDVPHTWNRLGNQGIERSPLTNDKQGTGWYRLRFQTPRAAAGSRYFLQFDAVGAIADVWMNGRYLGKHAGAFSRFRFDVSAFMNPSGDNLLAVKADNSRPAPNATTQDVIPLSGDFFVFGGIYRAVALVVTQPVHVDLMDFGGPGLYARALDINAAEAKIRMSCRLVDDAPKARNVSVEFSIEDAAHRVVASTALKVSVSSPAQEVRADLSILHPRLWQGTKDPYLYHTVLTIRSQNGGVLDRISQPLGLRTVKFDPDRGFFLNGEHLELKGASMHQDRPVKGWAISRADQEQDFDLLQELGANAVRLAHYPHDQYSYDLADARGIIVWAEIPLVNQVSFDGSPANPGLTANARQQLIELVRQNYNHPAIAVWSLGNEIDLTAQQTKGPSRPGELLRSLNALAKSEDPSRATTLADCCEPVNPPHAGAASADAAAREPIVGIADTVGYNRYFGWYTGQFADFGRMLDEAHARHPLLPIAVSEYGAGAALTQHSDDPAGGPINPHGRPHPEEYQNLYHENSWAAIRSRGYLWGTFIWNLFDFSSDSRREGDLTDINEKGLVSYDRQSRKDAFYFYRANWNSTPTLHLVGRRYVDRAYAVVDVKAYSNAPEVSLAVNGTPLGTVPCANGICSWPAVHLSPGGNELVVTARIAGRTLTDSMRWTLSHSERIVRIKAGDISGYTANDGQNYGSDRYFVGGNAAGINSPDTPMAARVTVLAADSALYDSFRTGEFAYRVPLPNGRYRVLLKFVEPDSIGVGDRLFDVVANQVTRLDAFDILASAGGKLKGVERSFDVSVSDAVLVLAFRPHRGDALVSALSIAPLE
jgi:beta-galactosidase